MNSKGRKKAIYLAEAIWWYEHRSTEQGDIPHEKHELLEDRMKNEAKPELQPAVEEKEEKTDAADVNSQPISQPIQSSPAAATIENRECLELEDNSVNLDDNVVDLDEKKVDKDDPMLNQSVIMENLKMLGLT